MTDLEKEFAEAGDMIGSVKVFEDEKISVWHASVAPGARLPAHRSERSYFWTALRDGKSRSRYADGEVVEVEYTKGMTKNFELTPATGFVHDLENVGDSELCFVTVEFNTSQEK